MSLAADALDMQLNLTRYYSTDAGKRYARGLGVDLDIPDAAMEVLHRLSLTSEDTYAVSTEIVELLEQAAPTIPAYTLHEDDPPTRSGFVYLERAIHTEDSFGKPLAVRALSWYPAATNPVVRTPTVMMDDDPRRGVDTKRGLLLMLFTDPADSYDHLHDIYVNEFLPRIDASRSRPPLYSLLGGVWQVDEAARDGFLKWLMAFFRFTQEAYVDTRSIRPERPALKRAARVGRPEPRIRVVRLRKGEAVRTVSTQHGNVEWTHRWVRRGHWREQPYGPNSSLRRPTWIRETICGPDDKPLIVNDRVFVVDR